MIVWCSHEGDKQVNALICIYSCPNSVKCKCKTYAENYEKIKALLIEGKYVDKYGPAGFILPDALKPKVEKRKRRTPAEMEVAKSKPVAKPKKEKAPVVVEVTAPEKPKRTRRTKAEMAEARK